MSWALVWGNGQAESEKMGGGGGGGGMVKQRVQITLRNASVYFGTAAVMKMGVGAGGGSRSRW